MSSIDSPSPHLLVEVDGAVATIVMNRPERLNAMDRRFWPDFRRALAAVEAHPDIRALIVTGAGERAFSAGGDIASFADLGDLVDRRAFQRDAMDTFLALERSPLPVIAAVNGYALGGGCELTLACDIVLASETAVFGLPEAGLGLVPGYGILRGPDRIGRTMTKLLIMSCRRIDAATALRIGLVQEVHPREALMPAARKLAGQIAKSSPLALEVGKRVIDRDLSAADFDYSVEAISLLQAAPDAAEGTSAFLEKRAPTFRSRR